ncbi:hypothetical protein KP509_13G015100 [Ceratopteris richardii]|uniref:Uncharacterized protein n=1 Tax=Ceratopteris richardii TaxID=49495 RepID=A0A8T2TFQ6_CERRI|nr:hypothetical protein KP509_13G015100 [Ceratopteris richardii]
MDARCLSTFSFHTSINRVSQRALKTAALPPSNIDTEPCQKELLIALLRHTHKALQDTQNQDRIRRRFRALHGQGPNHEEKSLSHFRQLRVLDVHEYVHSYVYLSYLQRLIESRQTTEQHKDF